MNDRKKFVGGVNVEKRLFVHDAQRPKPKQPPKKGNKQMPQRHTNSILSFILLVLVGILVSLQSGCAPKLPPEAVWEKDARALLDQADSQFSNKQYEIAMKSVDTFLYRYPTSRSRDRALYLLGDIRFSLRDYTRAINYYKELIEEFPASSYIGAAKYKLGQCYFELKDYDLAIANLTDRTKITDVTQLRRISEMLSAAYMAKKNYAKATKEFSYLAEVAETDQQKAGYRDRVRDLVEKNLTEDELKSFASGASYPADLAQLRLAGILIDKGQYNEAIKSTKEFLAKYPNHPEKTRAEIILNDAMTKITGPRYSIGALLPQTGQLAFFGDHVLKGIQLAVHEYNLQNPNDRVELLVKDTEGSPDKAVTVLNDLSSKGILAAIGPLLTKEAESIAPELNKLNIPVITPAASGEDIGKLSPWLFRNALTNISQATTAARFALDRNLKKIVIFYPDDAYGKDLARLFSRELERRAVVLASIPYPPETKDFGPYVRKVMEIDLRSRKIPIPDDEVERKKLFQDYTPSFDALYLPGYADRVGLLIPQLAFYNISGVTMIGSNNWHSQDLIERAQRYVEGSVFVDGFFPESTDPAIKPIIDAYRSANGEDPDILATQAYDAAAMILSFIKDHKNTPLAIRDNLLALRDFPGISGTTSFAGTGEAQKKLFLITIQDGKFVLYPAVK